MNIMKPLVLVWPKTAYNVKIEFKIKFKKLHLKKGSSNAGYSKTNGQAIQTGIAGIIQFMKNMTRNLSKLEYDSKSIQTGIAGIIQF